jgi:hypothetical protein
MLALLKRVQGHKKGSKLETLGRFIQIEVNIAILTIVCSQ